MDWEFLNWFEIWPFYHGADSTCSLGVHISASRKDSWRILWCQEMSLPWKQNALQNREILRNHLAEGKQRFEPGPKGLATNSPGGVIPQGVSSGTPDLFWLLQRHLETWGDWGARVFIDLPGGVLFLNFLSVVIRIVLHYFFPRILHWQEISVHLLLVL